MKKVVTKIKNAFMANKTKVITTVATSSAMVSTACAESDLAKNIKEAFNNIYGDIVAIASVAAGVCIAICAFLMFFSKSQNTVQESTAWMKRIIIAYAIVMIAGLIIKMITGFLGDDAGKSLWDGSTQS